MSFVCVRLKNSLLNGRKRVNLRNLTTYAKPKLFFMLPLAELEVADRRALSSREAIKVIHEQEVIFPYRRSFD